MSRLQIVSCPSNVWPHDRCLADPRVCLIANDGCRLNDDSDADEPWDDDELEEDLDPLDEADLEIDDEPDPDDGDFWIDPDDGDDPWN
jgi:hypothetical protein